VLDMGLVGVYLVVLDMGRAGVCFGGKSLGSTCDGSIVRLIAAPAVLQAIQALSFSGIISPHLHSFKPPVDA